MAPATLQSIAAPKPKATNPLQAKTVAILQSNYIPWKGYFDLIRRSDLFILYDDMQFTRRDWRNRNRIKTARGPLWLSIPVKVKGKFHQPIREVEIDDAGWAERHWNTWRHHYARAPFWRDYCDELESLYRDCRETLLSLINRRFLTAVCRWLNITTEIRSSSEYELRPGKTERLVDLCLQAGATTYLSGPAARDYLDESQFAQGRMTVEWMDYSGYPEYAQLHPPFDHQVSAIDLILNTGPDAPRYLDRSAS